MQYDALAKRPKSVGTFGTAAQRGEPSSNQTDENGVSHLGPGSYNTNKHLAINADPKKKTGYSFGTGQRKGLSDTENVPGPGNYNYLKYQNSEKGGYTISKASNDKSKTDKDGGKLYDTRSKFPEAPNYALPAPKDRKIKPPM